MNVTLKKNLVSNEHYLEVHIWIKKLYGKANKCEISNEHQGKFHWANISGCYLHNRKDWIKLCVQCHVALDRLNYSIKMLKKRELDKQKLLLILN